MKHLPLTLFATALGLGVIFDILFYNAGGAGLNIFLFQIAVIAAGIGMALYLDHHIHVRTIVAATFAASFAFTFAVWTSDLGLTLSGFGLVAANGLFFLYLLGHHGLFHHPVTMAFEGARRSVETVLGRMDILAAIKLPSVSGRNTAVVRGLLLAVPIVIIFGSLFLASDLVLQQKVEGIDTWLQNLGGGDILAQLMLIAFVAFCFLLFFAAAFWKRFEFENLNELVSQHRVESAIVLASANMLFFAFIIFQAVYLFGGQTAWDKIEGITYSEYAVQGFNELATVAVLVILLILTLRYFHAEYVQKKSIIFGEVALLVQTVAIVISAWMRMSLYVEQYAFSPARLFGFWFFLLAGTLLGLLAVHVLKRVPQYKYLQQAMVITGVAMLIFTMSAPDALAVKMNIARAEKTGEPVDAFPLFNQLSAEAYPIMSQVLTNEASSVGLLELNDYCEVAQPDYTETGALYSVSGWGTDTPIAHDRQLRSDISRFVTKWHNEHFVMIYPSGGEKSEPSEELRHDWRSWNWSRVRVPRNSEGELLIDLPDHKEFSVQEIAQACGIPTIDPNYVVPSTP